MPRVTQSVTPSQDEVASVSKVFESASASAQQRGWLGQESTRPHPRR